MAGVDEPAAGLGKERFYEVVGDDTGGKPHRVRGDLILLVDELHTVLAEDGRGLRQREIVRVLDQKPVLELVAVGIEILLVNVVHDLLASSSFDSSRKMS